MWGIEDIGEVKPEPRTILVNGTNFPDEIGRDMARSIIVDAAEVDMVSANKGGGLHVGLVIYMRQEGHEVPERGVLSPIEYLNALDCLKAAIERDIHEQYPMAILVLNALRSARVVMS